MSLSVEEQVVTGAWAEVVKLKLCGMTWKKWKRLNWFNSKARRTRNFLAPVIFILLVFLGMVIWAVIVNIFDL